MAESDLDIRYLANLARLELTDQEAETYGAQLSKIIHHVEQLSTIDVTGIEPTAHATPVFDVLREYQTSKGSPVMALRINDCVILPMVPVEKVEVIS